MAYSFTSLHLHIIAVRTYIASQEEHHRRVSFMDEYLEFLQRHEIEYDERFVFE